MRYIFEKERELLHDVVFQLLKSEVGHIHKSLKTEWNTTTKLLIKDDQNTNKDVQVPTSLVIPEINFTANLLKAGYLCIKAIIENHQIYYKQYTITQASQAKECLDNLKWTREKCNNAINWNNRNVPFNYILIGEKSDLFLHKEPT